ncbi:hypothetical protein G5714_000102 [Onychostoma macrolepis]|uniref:Ig-like domain-containing protein n=1 Tax=Onychostoma macrolepis TaxID=369639 RepID=A0A7J6DG37_9TELE|nr:hypothetical protein G5714_000102 [Onychostoma macrolepis]
MFVIRSAYFGQTITFNCKYDHKFKTHTKVFYRVNVDPVHVLNSSQSSQSSEEKFILTDRQKDHFTVTIRDISAEDDGVYLCGVERDGSDKPPSETSITHITFIKEIELNVYTTPFVISTSFLIGGIVIFNILYYVFVCVCVCVLHYKISKHRYRQNWNSTWATTDDISQAQEDFQDARRHTDPEPTHLYSTVQSTTIPSDTQNPIYSTVQSPTIPSDGLLYSSISFQKREESLSDATVRFRKEEIHCEYASVNHSISPN